MRTITTLLTALLLLILPMASCVTEDPVGSTGSSLHNDDGGASPGFASADGLLGGEGGNTIDGPSNKDICEKIPLEPIELPDISSGPSVVTLDAGGFFVVNGVKFFPHGFYGHPTDPADLQEFVDAGFNSTVSYGGCCPGGSLQGQIDKLNLLKDYGVMGSVHAFSPVSQICTESDATLEGWIDARNAAGSTLFWYTYDEPGIWSIPKDEVEDYYDKLKTLDPDHPNAFVMAPAEDFNEYIAWTDFLMTDPYPSPYLPLSWVKETVLSGQAACTGNQRVMGVGQTFDWYDSWGTSPPGHTWRPYVWEMRNMTYQFLTFGVNGLINFAYAYVHGQPERWAGLKEIAAEVKELMPILLELDAGVDLPETPDVPYVDYSVREHDGVYYVMIISTWTNDVTIAYDLSALGDDLCVIDYFAETEVPVADGGIVTLELPRAGEKVLQVIPL